MYLRTFVHTKVTIRYNKYISWVGIRVEYVVYDRQMSLSQELLGCQTCWLLCEKWNTGDQTDKATLGNIFNSRRQKKKRFQNFGVQVKICKIKVNLPKGYTSHQRNEATKNANAMDATTVPEDVNDEADIAMLLQDENEDADVS